MLAGVNDGLEQAEQLGALLQGFDVTVNLIPWNPIYSPGIDFKAPGTQQLQTFHAALRHRFRIPCTIRQEKGSDIAGACGQLVIGQQTGPGLGTSGALKDIEDTLPPRLPSIAVV